MCRETVLEQEVEDLTELLQEFYNYTKGKLDSHGHGSTYYFHELQPELHRRINEKIDT